MFKQGFFSFVKLRVKAQRMVFIVQIKAYGGNMICDFGL